MESQPQNPELWMNPENFHPCNMQNVMLYVGETWPLTKRNLQCLQPNDDQAEPSVLAAQ